MPVIYSASPSQTNCSPCTALPESISASKTTFSETPPKDFSFQNEFEKVFRKRCFRIHLVTGTSKMHWLCYRCIGALVIAALLPVRPDPCVIDPASKNARVHLCTWVEQPSSANVRRRPTRCTIARLHTNVCYMQHAANNILNKTVWPNRQ